MPRRSRTLTRPTVAIVAGERSGDILGGSLAQLLEGSTFGVTGPALRDAGCEPIGDISELSLVGVTEVLRHLPRLARRLAALEQEIARRRPGVVVTIDSPSFTLRLARRLRRRGIPVVHWVAPQVWAWRRSRAQRVHDTVDALACLFPFEPGLFGPHARFTGHPAGAALRSRRPLALGIAAGSRPSERARLGPAFARVASELGLPVVEAVPPGSRPVVPGASQVDDVRALAQHVSVALTAAGTATLELGCAGVPMVVAYATAPSTFAIARRLVRTQHIALPNLLLGRLVVPEHVQDVDHRALLASVERLLGRAGDAVSSRLLELPRLLSPATAVTGVADAVESYRTSSHFAASTKSL